MNKTVITSFCVFFGLTTIGLSSFPENPAMAQRKNISAKEVNGTFKTSDGSQIIKVLSVGKGGLDRPGYNVQVEMYTALQLGPSGEARGNTATLKGYAGIVGDTATFYADGIDRDQCEVVLKFTKPGTLKIEQKGTCNFNTDMLTMTGTYKKTSSAKPVFEGE
jgi:hypothetical protein